MNELDKIFSQSNSAGSFASSYISYLNKVLARFNVTEFDSLIKLFLDARKRDAQIFFIGNGGSATTASHFANDLAIGTRSHNKPFRAMSLTDNQAIVTAISNDNGFDNIFVLQLQALMRKGDLVVAISASGNSANLIKAVEYANLNGSLTVGITSFDGGQLQKIVSLGIHIPTNKGEYGPAEDAHMIINHLVGAYLIRLVANEE